MTPDDTFKQQSNDNIRSEDESFGTVHSKSTRDSTAVRSSLSFRRRTVLRAVGGGMALGLFGSSPTSGAAASFGDGVNLQPSYFCRGDQNLGWGLMNQYPDIQTVRIEIEPFSFNEVSTTRDDAKRWIDEANSHGYEVIASYHHYPDNGSSNASALQTAADWWVDHYSYLSQDSPFTINMMNEWGDHSVTASQYASAYNDALSTVRSGTNYSGPIVCDAPGWGQETHRLADATSQIDDDNIICSVHVYPSGWNQEVNEALQPSHLDVVDETGYPCMIGEFGNWASSPSGADWSAIVDHAKSLGWPVIGWAWNGDGSGDPMNMSSPYWGDDCGATSYSASSYFDVVYNKLGNGGNGGDDTTAPSQPPNLSVTGTTSSSVSVSWDGSTDSGGSGLAHYAVSVDGLQDQTVSAGTTTATVDSLAAETSYEIGVSAVDGAGNASNTSTVTATTSTGDGAGDVLAEVEPSTTTATVGERITFQVADTSGDERWITALDWTFGDGTTATGWWNEHAYAVAGTYTVAVTATANDGDTTTDEVTITVS